MKVAVGCIHAVSQVVGWLLDGLTGADADAGGADHSDSTPLYDSWVAGSVFPIWLRWLQAVDEVYYPGSGILCGRYHSGQDSV